MPLITHRGNTPQVHRSAYVAPTAVLCGDVHIGADASVLFGAVVTAEDGHVRIGRRCVVMENALVRGRGTHPVEVGDNVLIGPHAHVNGAVVGDGCFLATGCSLFPGSRLGPGVEVRINAVVHANTALSADAMVPIGWVAVGDPAQILPACQHEDIWAVQQHLDFSETVYGTHRDTPAAELMGRQSEWYGQHRDDHTIAEGR
ncbi:MAG: gamma carbonic anhydrase family protein [Nocardioidaceae bacterium]